jgi:Tetratricopeptide repeat
VKIAVYAIALNEEKFVERFVSSVAEADLVVVGDTGSTDRTAKLARAKSAKLFPISVRPWRFDDARNAVLASLPASIDVCISLDIDEILRPGWRQKLTSQWPAQVGQGVAVQGSFLYNWSHLRDGTPDVRYWFNKIHSRHGWRWTAPVHEVLTPDSRWQLLPIRIEGMEGDHFPDPNKSRGQYLDLLKLAVAENPYDDRMQHYLGREHYFNRQYFEAFAVLNSHRLNPAAFPEERSQSLRYMAKCKIDTGSSWDAVGLLHSAIKVAPTFREPRLDLAELYLQLDQPADAEENVRRALLHTAKKELYLEEATSYLGRPHDILSRALFIQNRLAESLETAQTAADLEPTCERFHTNIARIKATLSAEATDTIGC